ncbi:MAG: DUF721 domain-containing protein [Candidatus Omnitrophica bacterium]|nr:DUF721 domain-containing protein [Candidatus Omnitrophota bacterium]
MAAKKEKPRDGLIEKILKDVIKNLKSKKRVSEEDILKAWKEAAGEKAATHTKPVSIRRSVLTVNVDDSGWLYELAIKKAELVKKLEAGLGGKKIKGLRLRIGEIR